VKKTVLNDVLGSNPFAAAADSEDIAAATFASTGFEEAAWLIPLTGGSVLAEAREDSVEDGGGMNVVVGGRTGEADDDAVAGKTLEEAAAMGAEEEGAIKITLSLATGSIVVVGSGAEESVEGTMEEGMGVEETEGQVEKTVEIGMELQRETGRSKLRR
jgi:hypothetical protein